MEREAVTMEVNEWFELPEEERDNYYLTPHGGWPLWGDFWNTLFRKVPSVLVITLYHQKPSPPNQIIDGIEYRLVPVEG